jgi:hypothetical protein
LKAYARRLVSELEEGPLGRRAAMLEAIAVVRDEMLARLDDDQGDAAGGVREPRRPGPTGGEAHGDPSTLGEHGV